MGLFFFKSKINMVRQSHHDSNCQPELVEGYFHNQQISKRCH